MDRFDIALDKKKPIEKAIKKVKGFLFDSLMNSFQKKSDSSAEQTDNPQVPPSRLESSIEGNPGNWDSPDGSSRRRIVQGQTGTQVVRGVFGITGTQGFTGTQGYIPISWQLGTQEVQGQPGLTISSQDQLGIDISPPEQEESVLGEQIHREMAERAEEEERAFEEVARTMLNMDTSAITHSGDTMSSRGPTSRHLLIAGPDGYRIIIPLRSLAHSISENGNGSSTLHLTLSTREAQALDRDIHAGFQRQREVDGGRYG